MAAFTWFVRAYPLDASLTILGLFVAAVFEILGVSTLLPILVTALGGGQSNKVSLAGHLFASIGVPVTFESMVALLVTTQIFKGGLTILAFRQVGHTVARVASGLRLGLLRGLLRTRWIHFTRYSVGESVNSLGTEALRASEAFLELSRLASLVLLVLMYLMIAMFVARAVVVGSLVVGISVILMQWRLVRNAGRAGIKQTDTLRIISGRLADTLQGVKPLKAMGRESSIMPTLLEETRELEVTQETEMFGRETIRAVREPIIAVFLACGLFLGVRVAGMPITSLMFSGVLFFQVTRRVLEMQQSIVRIRYFESAYWSMKDAIRIAESMQEEHTGKAPPHPFKEIQLRNVAFAYGTQQVIDDVTLKIQANRFIAIVGPSGSGKSTLVDLILGLHVPQKGAIEIDGVPLRQIDLSLWRKEIGYVPQELFLFNDTVMNNITLRDDSVSEEQAWRALKMAEADGFVASLPDGLRTRVGERGLSLSGGQRQRIAVARALVHDPALLVLDEATTALDPATELAILAAIRKLTARTTVLAISHSEATKRFADQVFEFRNGKVLASVASLGVPVVPVDAVRHA